MQKKKQI